MMQTGRKKGLNREEVEASREAFGSNRLTKRKGKSFWGCFADNFRDPIIRILLGALVVNLLTSVKGGNLVESVGIALAVLLASTVSALSEQTSEKAFKALSEEEEKSGCRVVREGKMREIPMSEVVVGDLVLLRAGDRIPADGRLTQGTLSVDQSAMTGESREVEKTAKTPENADTCAFFRQNEKRNAARKGRGEDPDPADASTLFRGSVITKGKGEMTVTAVGDHSFLGGISEEIQSETRDSPLKLRLKQLARQISVLGYIAAAAVAAVFLFRAFVMDSGFRGEVILLKLRDGRFVFSKLLSALTVGLTVLVVAVPEGLPMMIAVVLSGNVRRMLRGGVLVRKPEGIEAAGSMNLLFTDKTGTLTAGKMKLESVILPSGETKNAERWLEEAGDAQIAAKLAFRSGGAEEGRNEKGEKTAIGGSATERALLSAVLESGAPAGWTVLSSLPFDSARKYSACTFRNKEKLTVVMGAPEILLEHTGSEWRGKAFSLKSAGSETAETAVFADPYRKNQTKTTFFGAFDGGPFRERVRREAEAGNRVLCLAVDPEGRAAGGFGDALPGGLSLVCAMVLSDPLKPGVSKAVSTLHTAGIGVVMVTGDAPETAKAIARRAGILTGERDLVLTGEELRRIGDDELGERLPRLAVVPRALPADKSRLVKVAQSRNLVVGMTGDGINDAPALKLSDVGFSMGSGTQVAKDAGDVVILDDSLGSIRNAVLFGRTVFKSIRKFITLQLLMNFCAVGVTVICPFFGISSPVTVVQMLWINLIMDTLGGLAFAGEAPLERYLLEPPKRRDEPILNGYMKNQILLHGVSTILLCLYFLYSPRVVSCFRPSPDRIYLLTGFFAFFIFSSVFNCFNVRSDSLKIFKGVSKNRVFILIMTLILFIQILFVYLGGSVLRTAPMTGRELAVTSLLALAVFPADLVRKCVLRLSHREMGY